MVEEVRYTTLLLPSAPSNAFQYTAIHSNTLLLQLTRLRCCLSGVGQCPRCESVSLTRSSPPTNATSPLPPTVTVQVATTQTNPKKFKIRLEAREMTPTVTFLFSSTDPPSSHKWCHLTLPSPTVTLGVSVRADQ